MNNCSVVKIQKQWRRFISRRKCYRFRIVANAVLLRVIMLKTPGRVPNLNQRTIEEELDHLLRKYRSWNNKTYYRFRAKTPDLIVQIRKKRNVELMYRLRMKETTTMLEKKIKIETDLLRTGKLKAT